MSSTTISPTHTARYDLSAGPAEFEFTDPNIYHGTCDYTELATSGDQMFTGCGISYRLSIEQAQDLIYKTSLPDDFWVVSTAHAVGSGRIAIIPKNIETGIVYPGEPDAPNVRSQVRVYTDNYFNPLFAISLPAIEINADTSPALGRFVFYSADESQILVLVEAARCVFIPNPIYNTRVLSAFQLSESRASR